MLTADVLYSFIPKKAHKKKRSGGGDGGGGAPPGYDVRVYNVFTFPSAGRTDVVLSPGAIAFLKKHGMNFQVRARAAPRPPSSPSPAPFSAPAPRPPRCC